VTQKNTQYAEDGTLAAYKILKFKGNKKRKGSAAIS
jgi:hypothetical protein